MASRSGDESVVRSDGATAAGTHKRSAGMDGCHRPGCHDLRRRPRSPHRVRRTNCSDQRKLFSLSSNHLHLSTDSRRFLRGSLPGQSDRRTVRPIRNDSHRCHTSPLAIAAEWRRSLMPIRLRVIFAPQKIWRTLGSQTGSRSFLPITSSLMPTRQELRGPVTIILTTTPMSWCKTASRRARSSALRLAAC